MARAGGRQLLLALLLALLALAVPHVGAIEAKCSACQAVAGELQQVLEKEKPRNHVDMRGRLDSKGVRYGKVIPYKCARARSRSCAAGAAGWRLGASAAASACVRPRATAAAGFRSYG